VHVYQTDQFGLIYADKLVSHEVYRCKTDTLEKTKEIYYSVMAFHMDFFAVHLGVLDEPREVLRKGGSVQIRTPTN
jgi:hypothetical protein